MGTDSEATSQPSHPQVPSQAEMLESTPLPPHLYHTCNPAGQGTGWSDLTPVQGPWGAQ